MTARLGKRCSLDQVMERRELMDIGVRAIRAAGVMLRNSPVSMNAGYVMKSPRTTLLKF
jgi:hypothetical protein